MKLFVFVVAIALLLRRTAESASCDSELIDGDKYRVSDQLFFTDRDTSEPAHLVREGSGRSWCTEEDLPVHDSPWIEVRFGVDVEIRALSTAGWHGLIYDEYVRSYQVQYARLGEQQLQYVTDQGSTSAKVFGRHDVPDLQRVELPAPIVAERIRIIVVPSSWTRSRACMRVEAHGCPVHTTCSSSRLSNDRSLLPLTAIVASSQTDDDPASDLVDTGNTAWCSDELLDTGPHIVLTFSQPVVLTHMIGRGGVGGLSYVTEFSIQSQISGPFEEYQQQQLSNGTIPFIAPDEEPTVFTFWRPLHANTSIRFTVLDATYNNLPFADDDFCFNVQLFGCLLSQANIVSTSMPLPTSSQHQLTTTSYGQSPSSMMPLMTSPLPSVTSYSPIPMASRSPMASSRSPMASRSPTVSFPPAIRLSSAQTAGVSVGVVVAVLLAILLTMAVIVILRLRNRKRPSNEVYMTVGNDMLYSCELIHVEHKETSSVPAVQLTSCHDNLYETVGEDKLELVDKVYSSVTDPMVDNPMYGGGACHSRDSSAASEQDNMTANPMYGGGACHSRDSSAASEQDNMTANPMYGSGATACHSKDSSAASEQDNMTANPMYGSGATACHSKDSSAASEQDNMTANPMYGSGATACHSKDSSAASEQDNMTANPMYGASQPAAVCHSKEEEPTDNTSPTNNPLYAGSQSDIDGAMQSPHGAVAENPLYGQSDQQ